LPNLGGVQTVTSKLACELRRRGNQVQVLTQKYPRTLPGLEAIDGIRVQRWDFVTPRWRDLRRGRADMFVAALVLFPITLARLGWLIARAKPDVVNLHFVGAPALFVMIARTLLRFRLVVSLHGDDVVGLSRGDSFDRRVFRAILRRSNAVTACSSYLLKQALAVEPSIESNARVVYNGTDLSNISPSPLPKGDTKVRLLAVGRMMPKKGFDVLLRAFSQLDRAACNPDLILIGDGPERGVIESLRQEFGLDGSVCLRGAGDREAVVHAMEASDIVVIPSREEPFGMVALEAMARGKPVVASRVGGLPEILDNADAILVVPDNPNALAQAINQTITRLGQEPAYGTHNREIASRFSIERMVDEYEDIYTDPSFAES
jgi:glycosyltransferase involved in cell wall biosynthesis